MGKRLKKGDKLACVPCGREIIVSDAGVAERTVWCCEKPMSRKSAKKTVKAAKKKTGRKK